MMSYGGSHVVGGTGLAPAVAELTCADGEACAHVGVAEGEDGTVFVDALCHDKLKHAVLILRDAEIGDRACGRVELGEVTTAALAMEHGHNLHGGLLGL